MGRLCERFLNERTLFWLDYRVEKLLRGLVNVLISVDMKCK